MYKYLITYGETYVKELFHETKFTKVEFYTILRSVIVEMLNHCKNKQIHYIDGDVGLDFIEIFLINNYDFIRIDDMDYDYDCGNNNIWR